MTSAPRCRARPARRGEAVVALEGDQGAAGAGAELAVHGHAALVGGEALLDGGHGVAALAELDGQHPRRPAAGLVALPSSRGARWRRCGSAPGGWVPPPSGPSPGTSRRGRWSAGRRCPWRRTAGRRPAAPSARPAGPPRTAGARPAAGRSPAIPATSGVSRASDEQPAQGSGQPTGAGAQVAGRGRWHAARSPSWKEPAGTGARAAEDEHRTEGSRVEATLIGSTGNTRRLSRIPQPRTPRAVDSPARPPRRSATLPSGAPLPGGAGAARPGQGASRGPVCGRCSGGGGWLRGRGGGSCRPGSRRSCPRTRWRGCRLRRRACGWRSGPGTSGRG